MLFVMYNFLKQLYSESEG